YSNCMKPVALPPGRDRLLTKPEPTGSGTITNTIGTVWVAWSTYVVVAPPVATITSGASAANSTASFRRVSVLPLPQRYSICTLRPSVQPNRCSAGRNAARRARVPASSAMPEIMPMRRIRSPCSARAASGHAAAAPPNSVMNFRLFIRSPHRRGADATICRAWKTESFNHVVGGHLHDQRHREAERLGGLEIDDQLELSRLQYGQVRRLLPFENPPHIDAGLTIGIGEACRVADQAAGRDIVTEVVDGRNGMARRQCNQRLTFAGEQWAADDHERARAGLDDACEGSIEFAFTPGVHRHNFLSDGAACLLHVARFDDRFREIWINQCGNDAGSGNQLTHHGSPFQCA